jgi:hypothetical protein
MCKVYSVIHVFMKQIFRAEEKAPPSSPFPPSAVQGVEYWLFSSRSSEFGYGFEAMRIRVTNAWDCVMCACADLDSHR